MLLSRVQARHWGLVGLAAAASGWWWSAPAAYGVLLGGGLIGSSVLLYAAGVGAVLRRGSLRLAIGLLSVKLLLFLGLVWLMFSWRGGVDPAAFGIGVGCFPVGAVWEAARARKDSSD